MSIHGEVFENLVQGLVVHDFVVMDDFILPSLVDSLRGNLQARLERREMKQAGVGQQTTFQKNTDIRRDLISWIDEKQADDAEKDFLEHVWSFIHYLNETCYTGLNALECHYAWYDIGSFYRKHKDQFKSDSGRKYSLVIYLNPVWSSQDGGQLVMYHLGEEIKIEPKGGRVVFFQSDKIEHEVLTALRPRLSIAGWMKR